MKKIKTSLAFIPFIAGGMGCFCINPWLGAAFMFVIVVIGVVIIICKASSGAEENIIALESMLKEQKSYKNYDACKNLLKDISTDILNESLYRRYKEAEKTFNEKY